MRKREIFSIVLMIFLILSLFGTVSGYQMRDRSYQAVSEDYTKYLIAAYGNVPVYDQKGEIVNTGIIKEIPDEKAMFEWYDYTHEIIENTRPNVRKYYYPDGPVIAYGSDVLGTIRVGINDEMTIDQNTIDEIRGFIDSEALKSDITDIPIIFVSEPIAKLSAARNDSWRPVIGGVRYVLGDHFGTTSYAATRNGQNGIVISGHYAGVGDPVYQPGSSGSIGTVTVSSNGDHSDAAWVSYSNVDDNIFEFSWTQPDVYGYRDPWRGLDVIMSGVISGASNGEVVVETDAWNDYFQKTIQNQYYADYQDAPGDSGAPVYYKDNQHRVLLVGNHWGKARYSIFSPISLVMDDLGITPMY